MGSETGIAWTDHTFNPWWGCVRVSPGCEHCYAETWDARWGESHWGPKAPRRFFGDAHWAEPLKWNRAAEKAGVRARVFCASMADVFEDRRDLDAQRARLFALIAATPALDWQLLTKRPENMVRLAPAEWAKAWPENVWGGTTVEDQQRLRRIVDLCSVPAAVRFISFEPLLGPIDTRPWLFGPAPIHWAIIGGESGGGARSMRLDWARSLVAQCKDAGVSTFVKQLGVKPVACVVDEGSEYTGADARVLVPLKLKLDKKHGGNPEEWPADLRVREFPR